MENTQFKLQGSIFAKLAKWEIDPIKWLEFWNGLRKSEAVGLINGTCILAKGCTTKVTNSGIRVQKIDGNLYVDDQLVGLDWRFTPRDLLNKEVPFEEFVSSIPLNQRLPAEIFNFLLKNPDLIPSSWDLLDRNGNSIDVMFTGSNFACPRGHYVPAIKRDFSKWQEVRHFKQMDDIIVYQNMAIAVKQGVYLND